MGDDVFISAEGIGDLYLSAVLVYFEYPRVFVCIDVYDSKCIFYEMASDDENKDVWLVSKIKESEYYDITNGRSSIQSVYEKGESSNIFSVTKIYGEKDQIILSYDNVESLRTSLPKNDVLADFKVNTSNLNKTAEKARTTSKVSGIGSLSLS